LCGFVGVMLGGLVGVALGMTGGYICVHFVTSGTAFVPIVGWLSWGGHHLKLLRSVAWFAVGSLVASLSFCSLSPSVAWFMRALIVIVWSIPVLWQAFRLEEIRTHNSRIESPEAST